MKHEDRDTVGCIFWAIAFVIIMGTIALWMATEPEPVFSTYGYRNTLTETVMEARR